MEIKNKFLFLQTKIEIVECLNKVKQLLLKGIKTENLFFGKLLFRDNIKKDNIITKNTYKYFCHAVFVKIKSTKRGDYYFYFHKDSNYCKLLNENPKNPINKNAMIKIIRPFDNLDKFNVSKNKINAQFIKSLNEKLEEYAIFGIKQEQDFDIEKVE